MTGASALYAGAETPEVSARTRRHLHATDVTAPELLRNFGRDREHDAVLPRAVGAGPRADGHAALVGAQVHAAALRAPQPLDVEAGGERAAARVHGGRARPQVEVEGRGHEDRGRAGQRELDVVVGHDVVALQIVVGGQVVAHHHVFAVPAVLVRVDHDPGRAGRDGVEVDDRVVHDARVAHAQEADAVP